VALMREERSFGEENVIEWDQFKHLPVMPLYYNETGNVRKRNIAAHLPSHCC